MRQISWIGSRLHHALAPASFRLSHAADTIRGQVDSVHAHVFERSFVPEQDFTGKDMVSQLFPFGRSHNLVKLRLPLYCAEWRHEDV